MSFIGVFGRGDVKGNIGGDAAVRLLPNDVAFFLLAAGTRLRTHALKQRLLSLRSRLLLDDETGIVFIEYLFGEVDGAEAVMLCRVVLAVVDDLMIFGLLERFFAPRVASVIDN